MRDQRVLIVEGPDGVGKTHIAKALSQDLKIPYFRHGLDHDYWKAGKLREFIEFSQPHYAALLEQTGLSLIADRAYPSEKIYSQVFGRETCPYVLDAVDKKFADMNATIFLFLRRDYRENKEDELVEYQKLRKLHEGYLTLVSWTRCNLVTMYTDAYQNELRLQLPLLKGAIEMIYQTPSGLAAAGNPVRMVF